MTAWPAGMVVDPIGEWPGVLTARRSSSPFSSNMTSTLSTLRRELLQLDAKQVRMQVAIPANQFRNDGFPRATARAVHPGIILTMDTNVGALSYPCDTFTAWEDNLRAIALALEALRKVDRYGVTKRGQQYRGFLAIEPPAAMPAGFTHRADAIAFIADLINAAGWTTITGDMKTQINQAKRLTHPDMGGNADDFQRVILAEQYLKTNGHIQ